MKFTFAKGESKKLGENGAIVRLEIGKVTKLVEAEGKPTVLKIGIGDIEKLSYRHRHIISRKIVSKAREYRLSTIAIDPKEFVFADEILYEKMCAVIAENFVLAEYEFDRFKSKENSDHTVLKEVIVTSDDSSTMKGFERGRIIGEEVNACRDLSNTPGGDMTPAFLGESARAAVKGLPVTVSFFDEKKMKSLGMGAVLGVGKGSPQQPKFIVMEYNGAPKKEKPIVLVGKGVTFDTGGLNLKPGDSMLEMHMDMSGGAAVIHALTLAAKLKLKKNVVALVPAVENMPGGESYRPGDILKSLSGKTIEILNTDAEGRVILADALTYAERYKPKLVVDVATLTGASLIALGQHASAIMASSVDLQEEFKKLGEESGDYVWPFPLWEEYEPMVKGNFGDFSNIPAKGNSRYGGVIGGGMFLYQFAKAYPWVHIDMAPRMTPSDGEYLAKGATGAPVRLLLRVIEHY